MSEDTVLTNLVSRLRRYLTAEDYELTDFLDAFEKAADEIERLEKMVRLCAAPEPAQSNQIDPNVAEVRAALSCWRQGTWNRGYAMEQFEKLLQGFVDRSASAHEPTAQPDTLVRWVSDKAWRCRCKPPGDLNAWGGSMCPDCGTARPERVTEPSCDQDTRMVPQYPGQLGNK